MFKYSQPDISLGLSDISLGLSDISLSLPNITICQLSIMYALKCALVIVFVILAIVQACEGWFLRSRTWNAAPNRYYERPSGP